MYIRADTPLPLFIPFPQFLIGLDISLTAKVLYSLLLNRTTLSQKSGWTSEDGYVYVVYPVKSLADSLGRSERATKSALRELEEADLLIRIRQGLNRPNHIFLKLPDEVQFTTPGRGSFYPSDGQFFAPLEVQGLPINKNKAIKTDRSKINQGGPAAHGYGEFQNVFLSDEQIARLQAECPSQYSEYINRLSAYMASSGKHYADHYATIRKWITEDNRRTRSLYDDPDDEGGHL